MSPDPLLGQTMSHYRILERLGEGGMGVVYLAEDLTLKRRVALKFLPADAVADPEARARLTHEAQAAASLLHPNICPVYEIAEADGQTFIAMGHLEGRTLRQRLADGPVPLAEALSIARQIGEGLAAAHAKGIVHRDVKPGNVMLLPDGRPVLMDFGLARVGGATRLTRTGTTLGTAAYMAPEQALGREADARSDVWALGVVLYELVSGKVPFGGEHEAAQLYAIVNVEPPPLTAVAPGVPAGLNGIVTKALAKEPARRYLSAGELAADLGVIERDVTAEPAGRGRRTRRQRAWLAAAIMLGTVAVVVALTALNVGGIRERLFEGGPRIRSIAVLPLANLSGDASQEYFADGMTEALINDLGQVSALRVISRTSAMGYKNTKKSLKEIARELHVDAIVEGSVSRSAGRVKISAQLIRAREERQLWADAFEHDLKDVMVLQGEMAGTIAGAVKAKLTPAERTRLARTRPVNPEAYQLYLMGKALNGQKALEYYERAIALDSTFAQAYMGVAGAYDWMAMMGEMPQRDADPKIQAATRRALELDSSLQDAHLAQAKILSGAADWAGAEREYRRAIESDPSNGGLHDTYGLFLLSLGRYDEAATEFEREEELRVDPPTPGYFGGLGWAFFYCRRFSKSIALLHKARELDPGAQQSMLLSWNYVQTHRYDEACAEAKRALDAAPDIEPLVAGTGWVFGLSGRRQDALAVLERLRAMARRGYVEPYNFAWLWDGLGNTDSTMAWLERGHAENSASMWSVKCEMWTDRLRADPRFKDLLRRRKLPPD